MKDDTVAAGCCADCHSGKRLLGNRSVADAAGAKPFKQSARITKNAGLDVLADQDNPLVAFHFLMKGLVNRFANRHFHH